MVEVREAVLVLLDTLLLVLKILYDIVLGIYRLCIPVEEKSVIGEIVLVFYKLIIIPNIYNFPNNHFRY